VRKDTLGFSRSIYIRRLDRIEPKKFENDSTRSVYVPFELSKEGRDFRFIRHGRRRPRLAR